MADVLRQYGPEYLERFGDRIPAEHRKVLRAITACRTGELGTIHYHCPSCGASHVMGRSCGNRHCPTCQQDKTRAWLERQTSRLLPCPYFLITFTVPEKLRALIRRHQRISCAAMFDASSEALKLLARDPKYIGTSKPGFLGVLHTWGRTLEYHPHVHYVVPGGGPSDDGQSWLPSRADFYVPVKALSKIYRAKFRAALAKAGLVEQVDPAVWQQPWVVHSQAVGDGRTSLKYLAPYVFRVAISDRRMVSCADGQVTFLYRKSGTRHWRKMTLDAMEFVRRFLQHVLPTGFMKVRHYGFLSPSHNEPLEAIRWLVALHYDRVFLLLAVLKDRPPLPAVRCAQCGAAMRLVAFTPPCRGPPIAEEQAT